jgi:class 3 adenylate cyclase
VIAVIECHDGTVNRLVGDEVMTLFGVPVACRHDATCAVAATLDLHSAIDEFALTRRIFWGAPLSCTAASTRAGS